MRRKNTNIYKLRNMFMILISISVICTSIGYSALSSSLMISGEAYVRVEANVRITNIKWKESNNEGYETYNSEYYKEGIKVFATLPNIDSSITYQIEITNKTDIIYIIDSVNELINSNEYMTYTIENIDSDILNNEVSLLNMTIKYKDDISEVPSNNIGVFELKFDLEIKDVTPPVLTTKVVSKTEKTATLNIKATDEVNGSGLSDTNTYKYCLSTSSTVVENCTWTDYNNGSNFNISVTNYGNYYLYVYAVSDNRGNVSDNIVNNQTYYIKNSLTFFSIINSYDYTGTEPVFTVPESGYYKLETWGAQGGTGMADGVSKNIGGYGGYSYGTVYLNKGQILYLNIGGKGEDAKDIQAGGSGGYNGGGAGGTDSNYSSSGGNEPGAGGGGATHIATSSGLLSTLSSNVSDILIVAGAGGGGAYSSAGGHGGGISGNVGGNSTTTGGVQTSGNGFGLGGAGSSYTGGSGAGGSGYYGGIGGTENGISGAGGSGYIGNDSLINKVMYCYNCTESSDTSTKTISTTNVSSTAISNYAKSGNGYAKITYIGDKAISAGDSFDYTYTGGEQVFTVPESG